MMHWHWLAALTLLTTAVVPYRVKASRRAHIVRRLRKVRAERKCGELLRDMAERGERETRGGDRKSNRQDDGLKTLDDLGLDESESRRFQQVAAVPLRQFEAHLKEAREALWP